MGHIASAGCVGLSLGVFGLAAPTNASPPVIIRTAVSGDANDDGRVNLDDLNTVISNFGQFPSAQFADGDFNYDGVVNILDLAALAANWGYTAPGLAATPSSTFTVRVKGVSAQPPVTLKEIPITAGAFADDPTLANAHCYRISLTLPPGAAFTCAGLNIHLSTGSFYGEVPPIMSDIDSLRRLSIDPTQWNTPGKRQHAFDTFVSSALPGTLPAYVVGHYPEDMSGASITPTDYSVAWADTAGETQSSPPTGDIYIAQLTVVGTTLSNSILPEPSGVFAFGALSMLMSWQSRRRPSRIRQASPLL